jgi:hypothetical protein
MQECYNENWKTANLFKFKRSKLMYREGRGVLEGGRGGEKQRDTEREYSWFIRDSVV